MLAAVLLAALLVARTCGERNTEISQEEAIAIAKQQVEFEPNDVRIRFQTRGVQSRPYWLVGLGLKRADASYEQAVNIVINADTGAVVEVRPVDL
jgi:Peptidase propeptide and YPEB domain